MANHTKKVKSTFRSGDLRFATIWSLKSLYSYKLTTQRINQLTIFLFLEFVY